MPDDSWRGFVTYEGKTCAKRTVYFPEVVIEQVPPLSLSEYVKKVTKDFKEEESLLQALSTGLPFELKTDYAEASLMFGDPDSTNGIRLQALTLLQDRLTFDFVDGTCFQRSDHVEMLERSTSWKKRGFGNGAFLKSGNCQARVYDHMIFDESRYMYLGTVTFNVPNSAKPVVVKQKSKKVTQKITCIKGKTTKVVSGSNPKCPKGYVRKK